MNPVLASSRFIFQNSDDVKIDMGKVAEFCNSFQHSYIRHWWGEAPFDPSRLSEKDRLNFLFFFNSISFCYWGEPKWSVKYNGKDYDGAWGMIAALGKAVENDLAVLDAGYLADLSKEDLEVILKGNVPIPLFEERWKILREISKTLNAKFNGEFRNVVKEAKKDSLGLLNALVTEFSSFDDWSQYKNKKVVFYKRAQLLISDVYQEFNGEGIGDLKNIEALTACADYKLPKVLRSLGVINYSKKLAEKIDQKMLIQKDSAEENEIRGNTIWAVELMKEKLKRKIPHITSFQINDRLWLLSQKKSPAEKLYHRAVTTSY